jgi:hypothetical protein
MTSLRLTRTRSPAPAVSIERGASDYMALRWSTVAPMSWAARLLAKRQSQLRSVFVCRCGEPIPKYFFTVYACEEEAQAEYSSTLSDDVAAFAYACDLARELARSKDNAVSNLRVNVGDEERSIVFSIPLLPASA